MGGGAYKATYKMEKGIVLPGRHFGQYAARCVGSLTPEKCWVCPNSFMIAEIYNYARASFETGVCTYVGVGYTIHWSYEWVSVRWQLVSW